MSFSKLKELISSKLNLEITLDIPYKLCDFKPTYGYIFSEYLKKYQFWGHGDEDLVLGDVASFLPKDIDNLDVISFREEWNSGPFCLYRNIEKVNALFKQSNQCPRVFQTKDFEGFDETFLQWSEYRKENFDIFSVQKQSITYLAKKAHKEGILNVYYKTIIKESIGSEDFVFVNNGHVSQKDGKEFLLYHFITEKKNFVFKYPNWNTIPEKYYIDNTGFFTEEEFLRWRKIVRLRRNFIGLFRKIAYYGKRVKQKLLS